MGSSRSTAGWGLVVSMMLVSLVSYVDRNTLALLSPTILGDLHLSYQQYGWVVSGFSIAYTIGNPLWGAALDRLGLRRGMLLAVGLWSVVSAAHAYAGTFGELALARIVLGLGEGATFPAGLRAAQALPEGRRGRGMALAYSGGSAGAILTPLVVNPLAIAFGWRAAFLFTGLLGAAWLAFFARLTRGERAGGAPQTEKIAGLLVVRGSRLRPLDPRLWAFVAVYALGALPLGFVLYGAPIYLHAALGLSQSALGPLLWLPPLGWEMGYLFWGWQIDRTARTGPMRSASLSRLFGWLAILSLPMAATRAVPGLAGPMVLFCLATFVAAGFIVLALAYGLKVFSSQDAGLLAGIGAGSWSAVVAALMPIFGRMFDRAQYGKAFVLATAAPIVGVLGWRVAFGLRSGHPD